MPTSKKVALIGPLTLLAIGAMSIPLIGSPMHVDQSDISCICPSEELFTSFPPLTSPSINSTSSMQPTSICPLNLPIELDNTTTRSALFDHPDFAYFPTEKSWMTHSLPCIADQSHPPTPEVVYGTTNGLTFPSLYEDEPLTADEVPLMTLAHYIPPPISFSFRPSKEDRFISPFKMGQCQPPIPAIFYGTTNGLTFPSLYEDEPLITDPQPSVRTLTHYMQSSSSPSRPLSKTRFISHLPPTSLIKKSKAQTESSLGGTLLIALLVHFISYRMHQGSKTKEKHQSFTRRLGEALGRSVEQSCSDANLVAKIVGMVQTHRALAETFKESTTSQEQVKRLEIANKSLTEELASLCIQYQGSQANETLLQTEVENLSSKVEQLQQKHEHLLNHLKQQKAKHLKTNELFNTDIRVLKDLDGKNKAKMRKLHQENEKLAEALASSKLSYQELQSTKEQLLRLSEEHEKTKAFYENIGTAVLPLTATPQKRVKKPLSRNYLLEKVQRLVKMIGDLEKQIRLLNTQLSTTKTDHSEHMQMLTASYQSELEAQSSKITKLNAFIEKGVLFVKDLDTRYTSLVEEGQKFLQEEQSHNQMLREALGKVREELQQADAELQRAEEVSVWIGELASKNQELSKKIELLQAQVRRLKTMQSSDQRIKREKEEEALLLKTQKEALVQEVHATVFPLIPSPQKRERSNPPKEDYILKKVELLVQMVATLQSRVEAMETNHRENLQSVTHSHQTDLQNKQLEISELKSFITKGHGFVEQLLDSYIHMLNQGQAVMQVLDSDDDRLIEYFNDVTGELEQARTELKGLGQQDEKDDLEALTSENDLYFEGLQELSDLLSTDDTQ